MDPDCATIKTHSTLTFYKNTAQGWSFDCVMENQLLKQQHGFQNWLKTLGFRVCALGEQSVICRIKLPYWNETFNSRSDFLIKLP